MTKEAPNQAQNESLLIPFTKEYQICQSTLQFPAVGSLGENTAAATVPPSAQSISINAAGCLTCTRNTARLNALAYHFPPVLSLTYSEPNVHYHAACLREKEGEND